MKFLLAVLLTMSVAVPVLAAPAITCHCFQDRAFDPRRPAAADPYLLATAQNSFFAEVFELPKKKLVRAKMAGILSEELWVTYFVADRTGKTPGTVEVARNSNSSWKTALASLGITPQPLGSAFAEALAAGETTEALATTAVDETLITRLGACPADLRQLRAAGASDQEAILAIFLARRSGQSAREYFAEVRAGHRTWGSLLEGAGVEAASLEEEIGRLLL